jgi:hypothetical protein
VRTTTVLSIFSAHLGWLLKFFPRRRWREHAVHLILGLLLLPRFRSIAGIAREVQGGSPDDLHHFLHDSPWDWAHCAWAHCSEIARRLKDLRGPTRLIIDDTPVARNGRRIEGCGMHYGAKGLIRGQCAVTSAVERGGLLLGFLCLGYQPKRACGAGEFRSKVQLAQEVLGWASVLLEGPVTVLLDSWYSCKSVLKQIQAQGWRYVAALKSNRRVRVGGRIIRVSALAKGRRQKVRVRISRRRVVSVSKTIVELPGVGTVALFVTEVGDAEKFLVSNELALMPEKAVREYAARWGIETMHRDLKQHPGFGELWMRSWLAVQRHWTLCLAGYNALKLWNASLPSRQRVKTVGAMVRKLRRQLTPRNAGSWVRSYLKAA